jgi:CMP/dCMP kinase
MKYISVAIDGPSGAGKSTVARAAAAQLGYVYVDTGAMYRTIGLAVCRRGISGEDTEGIRSVLPDIRVGITYENGAQHVLLNGEDVSSEIRTPEIAYYAALLCLLLGQIDRAAHAEAEAGGFRYRNAHTFSFSA